ncbi:uncharacterized protein BDV17DRAFT_34878 [Aspergillus undulatus]|uniref:uncharacterized protein n=1 Tax=Aspergillus undulatus TaxID=1810928 RepID=UPI003CCD0771
MLVPDKGESAHRVACCVTDSAIYPDSCGLQCDTDLHGYVSTFVQLTGSASRLQSAFCHGFIKEGENRVSSRERAGDHVVGRCGVLGATGRLLIGRAQSFHAPAVMATQGPWAAVADWLVGRWASNSATAGLVWSHSLKILCLFCRVLENVSLSLLFPCLVLFLRFAARKLDVVKTPPQSIIFCVE